MNQIQGPSEQLGMITECIAQHKPLKVNRYGDTLAFKEVKHVRLDRFQVGNLVYLRIAHFISNNQDKLNANELNQLHQVLSKEISAIRADTGGIRGFFRYLFHQSDKSARLQQKEYLEGLRAIVENIIEVQGKEKQDVVEKKVGSFKDGKTEEKRLESDVIEAGVLREEDIEEKEGLGAKRLWDSDVVKIEQEIERLQKALVWVLKIKLDGLKGQCLNYAGAVKAFTNQNGDFFSDEEGKLFLSELQNHQDDLKAIPYYAKLSVEEGDIHTRKEISEKVKYMMERATSLHKQAKLLLPKLPKGTEERKNFVKLLTKFAEKLNQQQLIFKTPSSDAYINGMQQELGKLKKSLMD